MPVADRIGLLLRSLRGWVYRVFPGWGTGAHRRRVIGWGRKWDAEEKGRTWEGFCRLVWERLCHRRTGGRIFELAAGDGLVGSLGRWLEDHHGWQAECWETREVPRQQLSRFRPKAILHPQDATVSSSAEPVVILSRSCRMHSVLWRGIQRGVWSPRVVGLWNGSGRGLWARRMRFLGYRLALCRDRLEIYRK